MTLSNIAASHNYYVADAFNNRRLAFRLGWLLGTNYEKLKNALLRKHNLNTRNDCFIMLIHLFQLL